MATRARSTHRAPVRRKNATVSKDITTAGPSRRSIAKGAAWAVPAISVAAAAPSLAASPVVDCTQPANWQSNISLTPGCLVSVAGANVGAGWTVRNTGVGANACPIPAGAVFTERVWVPSTGPVSDITRATVLSVFKLTLTVTGLPTALFDSFTQSAWTPLVGSTVTTIGGVRALQATRTLTLKAPLAPGQSVTYGTILDPNVLDLNRYDLTTPGGGQTAALTGAILGGCS